MNLKSFTMPEFVEAYMGDKLAEVLPEGARTRLDEAFKNIYSNAETRNAFENALINLISRVVAEADTGFENPARQARRRHFAVRLDNRNRLRRRARSVGVWQRVRPIQEVWTRRQSTLPLGRLPTCLPAHNHFGRVAQSIFERRRFVAIRQCKDTIFVQCERIHKLRRRKERVYA